MDEKLIAEYMKTLDLSRDEAIQLIMDDKAIDKGEKLFELSTEQKKVAKKYTMTGTRNTHAETGVYNWKRKPNRKENPTKRLIISEIFKFLSYNNIFDSYISLLFNCDCSALF